MYVVMHISPYVHIQYPAVQVLRYGYDTYGGDVQGVDIVLSPMV